MAPTVLLTSKFTTARMRLTVALCVLVIASVCIVSHSMCDAQINYESLESCLLHEYKCIHTKFRKCERNQVSVVILCSNNVFHMQCVRVLGRCQLSLTDTVMYLRA